MLGSMPQPATVALSEVWRLANRRDDERFWAMELVAVSESCGSVLRVSAGTSARGWSHRVGRLGSALNDVGTRMGLGTCAGNMTIPGPPGEIGSR